MNNPIKQILERHATATAAVEAEGAEIAALLCEFVGWEVCRPRSKKLIRFTEWRKNDGDLWHPCTDFKTGLNYLRILTTAIAEKIGAEWVNAGIIRAVFGGEVCDSIPAIIEAMLIPNRRWESDDSDLFAILNATAKERLAALALAVAAFIENQGE